MIHSDRHKGPQEAKYLCPNTRWISSIRVILSMLPRCVRRATIGPYGSVHQITPPLPRALPCSATYTHCILGTHSSPMYASDASISSGVFLRAKTWKWEKPGTLCSRGGLTNCPVSLVPSHPGQTPPHSPRYTPTRAGPTAPGPSCPPPALLCSHTRPLPIGASPPRHTPRLQRTSPVRAGCR